MGNTRAYFVALSIVAAGIGHCEARSGNEIRSDCRVPILRGAEGLNNALDALTAGYCAGLVRGILVLGTRLTLDYRFCPPPAVTTEQGARVLYKYLNTHPETSHLSAEDLALAAFRTAWPCS
jgi:hypothetical protein